VVQAQYRLRPSSKSLRQRIHEKRHTKSSIDLCGVNLPGHSEAAYLLFIAEVVPLQRIACFMAMERGVYVERPRGLSKEVLDV